MNMPNKLVQFAGQGTGGKAGSEDAPAPEYGGRPLPQPKELIDEKMIEDTVFSTLQGTIKGDEARRIVKKYHEEAGHAQFVQTLGLKREAFTRAQEEFEAISTKVAEVESHRNSFEQYTDPANLEAGKQKPWTKFTGFEFGFLFAAVLVALVNGALAIANYLMARPEYADGMVKAFGIGLSILLLPSLVLTMVYHFLRRYKPKLAAVYAMGLFASVLVCVLIFITAFGLDNAPSTDSGGGEMNMANIGMADAPPDDRPESFKYLPAIALIFQILTDLLAAAAAKIGLVFLWENHGWVWRPRNPQWGKQNEMLIELKAERGRIKARFERLKIEIAHLEEESTKYAQRVATLADTIFCRKYQGIEFFKNSLTSI